MKESQQITIEILLVILVLLLVSILIIGGYILVKGASGKKGTVNKMNHWFTTIQPHLLVFFLILFISCVIFSTLYYSKNFLPYPASSPATEIVPLFNTTTVITGIAFLLTQVLLFYFAFRYRTMPNRSAAFFKDYLKLELTWTIIPALVFIFLFLWGQVLWAKITAEPEADVLEIEIVGQQYNWKARYPGNDKKLGKFNFKYIDQINDIGIDFRDPNSHDDFIPIQMHIPKNRPVKLLLRSKDVIHSFFIPYFRIKMDALPGMVTKIHFTANTSTVEMREKLNDPEFNYEVACAELCGRMHFAMKFILVVDEPKEFEKWSKQQKSWLALHSEYLIL
jgi:cytochrome c oxidase subunit 2